VSFREVGRSSVTSLAHPKGGIRILDSNAAHQNLANPPQPRVAARLTAAALPRAVGPPPPLPARLRAGSTFVTPCWAVEGEGRVYG
jgi:hypothetical protein